MTPEEFFKMREKWKQEEENMTPQERKALNDARRRHKRKVKSEIMASYTANVRLGNIKPLREGILAKKTFSKYAPLPDDTDLESFEKNNQISLPNGYKSFLLYYNPVTIIEKYYTKDNTAYEINSFYPFTLDSSFGLQTAFYNLLEVYDRKYIGFAADSGGWEYVISLRDEDYGKIYFCRMDEAIEDALTLLADDFEYFIAGLHEE